MARGLTNVNGRLYACAESRVPGFAGIPPGRRTLCAGTECCIAGFASDFPRRRKAADKNRMDDAPKILFVDDEETIRLTLPPILQSYGFNVTCAATVSEALGLVAQQRFDVLISDLN